MTASIRTAGVDLSGLMSILGQHLYSTPAVALRELVQNAHDSITRRMLEDADFINGSIRVWADQGSIHIEDEGAGLTEPEIHSFLATIGAGYTRLLRQSSGDERLIGLFGLGFLSAFVLAKRVTVVTTSYKNLSETWRYRSMGDERYVVEPEEATKRIGTRVSLELKPQYLHLADMDVLRGVLTRYCALLTHPIRVGAETGEAEAVNAEPPPWRMALDSEPPVRMRKRKLEFAQRFERHFEPLCTMDVAPEAGEGTAGEKPPVGLLWVQDNGSYATSDNRNLSVFVRGMLLDDDARDLLPVWAGFIGGCIEADALTPTASREDFQRDAHYDAVKAAVEKALVTGLARLPKEQPEAWRRILARHNEALLGAALCDETLFAILADMVHIPTTQGDRRVADLVAHRRVHVSLGSGGFEEMLFRAQQIPVALGERYAVLPFLKRWCDRKGMTFIRIGTSDGDRSLFTSAELAPDVKAWLSGLLLDKGEDMIPASFAPDSLPFVVVHDREAELKRRLEADDADRRLSQAALRLARMHTDKVDGEIVARFYLNMQSRIVRALIAAHTANDAAALAKAVSIAGILKAFKAAMAADTDAIRRDLGAAFMGMAESVEALIGIGH